jgi:hypothetical protein
MALQLRAPARDTFEGLGMMHRLPSLHSHDYGGVDRVPHLGGRTSLDPCHGMRLDIAIPIRRQQDVKPLIALRMYSFQAPYVKVTASS